MWRSVCPPARHTESSSHFYHSHDRRTLGKHNTVIVMTRTITGLVTLPLICLICQASVETCPSTVTLATTVTLSVLTLTMGGGTKIQNFWLPLLDASMNERVLVNLLNLRKYLQLVLNTPKHLLPKCYTVSGTEVRNVYCLLSS